MKRVLIVSALFRAAMAVASAQSAHPRVTNPEPALPIPAGPYQPSWESLEQNWHAPEWFLDGKFGIFLHWGVYSVAARQSEWYPRHMYATRGVAEWHAQEFGDNAGYKDLVPLFRAEKFDPAAWADLFRKAGAKYVMPVAEHHDGFAMWDSALTKWDAMDQGPHRDLVGELAAACRADGLNFGVSYHRMENWSFMYPAPGLEKDIFDPAYADFYGPPQPPPRRNEQQGEAEVMNGRSTPQSPEFLNEWLRRGQELVDKYQPDMIFFDNGVNGRGFDPVKLQFAAYYYNRAAQWGKQAALATKGINAAAGPAYLAGTVLDFERGHPSDIRSGAWQTDTTVHHRWGILDVTVYRNAGQLIRELIDNVSKGGNLLLNFAPAADGTIPREQQALLLEMGEWLTRNGEAIYGTRPWKKFGEGPTQLANPGNLSEPDRIHREAVGDVWLPAYTGKDWRFTTKGDTLYAIAMNWPYTGGTITSLPISAGRITGVELFGHGPVEFSQDGSGLHLQLPTQRPGNHAYAFKITGLKP